MTVLPLVSTGQISRLIFRDSNSPQKRSSELVKELEKRKLVEGYKGEIGKDKIWRLSCEGRKLMKVNAHPMRMRAASKVDHTLAIGDFYLDVLSTGQLQYFRPELREKYIKDGKELVYTPDAFFILSGKAYLLELQRHRLSLSDWKNKWRKCNEFFIFGHDESAEWQKLNKNGKVFKPSMLVITKRNPEDVLLDFQAGIRTIVVEGSNDFLNIVKAKK